MYSVVYHGYPDCKQAQMHVPVGRRSAPQQRDLPFRMQKNTPYLSGKTPDNRRDARAKLCRRSVNAVVPDLTKPDHGDVKELIASPLSYLMDGCDMNEIG